MADLRIGSTDVADVRIGSTEIASVFKGTDLVWQRAPDKPLAPTNLVATARPPSAGADVVVAVTRQAAPTTPGTVSITTPDLGGKTPKAVIVISDYASADGVARSGLSFGYGFYDGTTQAAVITSSENGVTTTNTRRHISTSAIAQLKYPGNTDILVADGQSFVPDGMSIRFTTTPASDSPLLTYVFFAGDDLQAYVSTQNLNGTTPITVTPNFETDLLFALGNGRGGPGGGSGGGHAFGAATKDGTNRCIRWRTEHGAGTSDIRASLDTTGCAGYSDWYITTAQNFTSTSFDMVNNIANSDMCATLALNLGGLKAWVDTYEAPQTTGDAVTTGVGFQPQWLGFGLTGCDFVDSVVTGNDAAPFTISACTTTAQFSNAWGDRNGQSTTNTKSLSGSYALGSFNNTVNQWDGFADYKSFDADGFTLDCLSAWGDANQGFVVAIEDPNA